MPRDSAVEKVMLSDVLQISDFAIRLSKNRKLRKRQQQVLLRAVRVELSSNLNLLSTVVRTFEQPGTEAPDKTGIRWLLSSLLTDALETYLLGTVEPPPFLPKEVYESDTLQELDSFTARLEWILIKIREMRAIAESPEGAPLPEIKWKQRLSNIREAHREAVAAIRKRQKS